MPGPQPSKVTVDLDDPRTPDLTAALSVPLDAPLAGSLAGLRAAARTLVDLTHVVVELDAPTDPSGAGAASAGAAGPVASGAASDPARTAAGCPHPPWLTDVDTRWQRARHALLGAARVGVDELHAVHTRHAAAAGARVEHAALGATHGALNGAPEPASTISGRPTVFPWPHVAPARRTHRPAPPLGQLPVGSRDTSFTPADPDAADAADFAIELWADRVRVCTEALHVLDIARCSGARPDDHTQPREPAEPYRRWHAWLEGHHRRWQALHHDAITVLDALHTRDARQPAPHLALDALEQLHPAPLLPPGARARYAPDPRREPDQRDQPGTADPGLDPAPMPNALDALDAGTAQLNAHARIDDEAAQRPADRPDGPLLRLTTFGAFALERRTHPQPDTTPRSDAECWEPLTGATAKGQELLLYLAAHPNGVRRDALISALWPDARRDRPTNALNTTLYRLRATLDPRRRARAGRRKTLGRPGTEQAHECALVARNGPVFYLDPAVVEVDYWTFLHAAQAMRATPDQPVGVSAAHTIAETYQGPFAADLTGAWVESLRVDAHQQHLSGVFALVEHHTRHEPGRVLAVLEVARNLHPGHERIAGEIMQVHADHAHPDLVNAAYRVLISQLADLDDSPSPETRDLHRRLLTSARQRFTSTSRDR